MEGAPSSWHPGQNPCNLCRPLDFCLGCKEHINCGQEGEKEEGSRRRRQTPMEYSLTVPQWPFALQKLLVKVRKV